MDRWTLDIDVASNGTPILIASWNGHERHRGPCDPRRTSDCGRFTRDLAKLNPAMEDDPELMRGLESEYVRMADELNGRKKVEVTTHVKVDVTRYIPFPLDCLPDPLPRFIREGAAAIQCDPAMIALPLLAGLASAIGNSRRVRLKRTWTEPAVIWAVPIALSGRKKSPSTELAHKPVWARQQMLLAEYRQARAAYEDQRRQWKETPKSERGDEPEPPLACEHPICYDVTVEALAVVLEATPRGTLVAPDELAGWFGSFDQYKGGRGADVSHWISMHRAGPLKVDRKGGEKTTIYIPHASVCVTGTIQPDTLRRCLSPEYIDNGLAARLLLAWPPQPVQKWSEDELDPAVEQEVNNVYENLYELTGVEGANGHREPQLIDLDDAAKLVWAEFFDKHAKETAELSGSPLGPVWSKLEGCAARLALILHCVRQAAGEPVPDFIGEQDMRAGVTLADWFGAEAKRVYGMLAETNEERRERELVEWIKGRESFVSVRDMVRGGPCCKTVDEAEAMLMRLVEAGRGRWEHRQQAGPGGPKPRVFILTDTTDTDRTPEIQRESGVFS